MARADPTGDPDYPIFSLGSPSLKQDDGLQVLSHSTFAILHCPAPIPDLNRVYEISLAHNRSALDRLQRR